jgi:hypothetical protein
MGHADRHFDVRSLDDARAYRIDTYNDDGRDQFLLARLQRRPRRTPRQPARAADEPH